jgi:hypothetical protein
MSSVVRGLRCSTLCEAGQVQPNAQHRAEPWQVGNSRACPRSRCRPAVRLPGPYLTPCDIYDNTPAAAAAEAEPAILCSKRSLRSFFTCSRSWCHATTRQSLRYPRYQKHCYPYGDQTRLWLKSLTCVSVLLSGTFVCRHLRSAAVDTLSAWDRPSQVEPLLGRFLFQSACLSIVTA